jgi:predicted nicotinamide N-methyase
MRASAFVAEDILDRPWPGADLVLAGDLFYERETAPRVLAFLDRAIESGAEALVGDPGRSYLPTDRLRRLAEYAVPQSRELEDQDIKRTAVWRFRPLAANVDRGAA